jgi:hypothetical protein
VQTRRHASVQTSRLPEDGAALHVAADFSPLSATYFPHHRMCYMKHGSNYFFYGAIMHDFQFLWQLTRVTPVPSKEAITRPWPTTQVIYYVIGRKSGSKREVVTNTFNCLVRSSWEPLKKEGGKLTGIKVTLTFVTHPGKWRAETKAIFQDWHTTSVEVNVVEQIVTAIFNTKQWLYSPV